MSIFSTIGKVAQGLLNPMGAVIDLAGSALGLPAGVKNVAKVGLGAVTGNFATVASGAVGLASSALKGDAKTEYQPSAGGSSLRGYAPSAAGVSNPDGKLRDAVSTLQVYFNDVDKLGSPLGRGLISKGDLVQAAKSSKVPPQVREAARYLLDHPATRDLVDSAKNGKVDGLISMKDLDLVLRQLDRQPPWSGPVGHGGPVHGNGPCRKVDNPSPRDIHCGPTDRKPYGHSDSNTITTTTTTTTTSGLSCGDNKKSSGCRAPDSFKSILNNPNLSTEEKIQAVLAQIADGADKEILDVMDQMSDLSSRKAGMSKEDGAKTDSSMEQLQLRLQKLTERRKQMFELMSNISNKYNEMSNHAIQNLGKA